MRKALIYKRTLLTNLLRKCKEISLENFYLDMGLHGLRTYLYEVSQPG